MASHLTSHDSEWIYSTFLSQKLSPLNEFIHNISSVSPPIEIFIAACGYAFNPVMIPFWPLLIIQLTSRNKSDLVASPYTPQQRGILNAATYLVSVLITLICTEIGKASFATTRPKPPEDGYDTNEWKRRYGKMVASLKSKHSFPSGDSAQAMNLCMFICTYVCIGSDKTSLVNVLLFGVFLPGVAFARVFYRCHWIEDCIGGILLSFVLHLTLIPAITERIRYLELTASLLNRFQYWVELNTSALSGF